MGKFVCIGQMFTIPSQQKITSVERCYCQMKCISFGIYAHELTVYVSVYDITNFHRNMQYWDIFK